jgi:hypothetical protein
VKCVGVSCCLLLDVSVYIGIPSNRPSTLVVALRFLLAAGHLDKSRTIGNVCSFRISCMRPTSDPLRRSKQPCLLREERQTHPLQQRFGNSRTEMKLWQVHYSSRSTEYGLNRCPIEALVRKAQRNKSDTGTQKSRGQSSRRRLE